MLVENNLFYSNNFNVYEEDSSVNPAFPFPVGTGLWIAGGNRQRGPRQLLLRQLAPRDDALRVPDQLVCGPRPDGRTSRRAATPTARRRRSTTAIHDNFMGVRPDGHADPNGTDFWWDPYPGTIGNCWWDNKAAPGKSVTTSPLSLPSCADGTQPGTSIGVGDAVNESELVGCLAGFEVSGYPDGSSEHLHVERHSRQAGQRPRRDRRGHGGSPDGPARGHLRRRAVAAAVPGVPEPGAGCSP